MNVAADALFELQGLSRLRLPLAKERKELLSHHAEENDVVVLALGEMGRPPAAFPFEPQRIVKSQGRLVEGVHLRLDLPIGQLAEVEAQQEYDRLRYLDSGVHHPERVDV